MKFFLLTEEYDTWGSLMSYPYEVSTTPLQATNFEAALKEAETVFKGMKRYGITRKSPKDFPRNPRLACEVKL